MPTWFASAQWMLLSLALWALAATTRWTGRSRLHTSGWVVAALLACYLSADEVGVLHERLGTVAEEIFHDVPLNHHPVIGQFTPVKGLPLGIGHKARPGTRLQIITHRDVMFDLEILELLVRVVI